MKRTKAIKTLLLLCYMQPNSWFPSDPLRAGWNKTWPHGIHRCLSSCWHCCPGNIVPRSESDGIHSTKTVKERCYQLDLCHRRSVGIQATPGHWCPGVSCALLVLGHIGENAHHAGAKAMKAHCWQVLVSKLVSFAVWCGGAMQFLWFMEEEVQRCAKKLGWEWCYALVELPPCQILGLKFQVSHVDSLFQTGLGMDALSACYSQSLGTK